MAEVETKDMTRDQWREYQERVAGIFGALLELVQIGRLEEAAEVVKDLERLRDTVGQEDIMIYGMVDLAQGILAMQTNTHVAMNYFLVARDRLGGPFKQLAEDQIEACRKTLGMETPARYARSRRDV